MLGRSTAEKLRQGAVGPLYRIAACMPPFNECSPPVTWITDSLRTSRLHECHTKREAALARRNTTVTLDKVGRFGFYFLERQKFVI